MSTYVILTETATQTQLDDSVEKEAANVRQNDDQTKCVLKYSGSQPASFSGETEYTHSEIMVEMDKAEWQAGSE